MLCLRTLVVSLVISTAAMAQSSGVIVVDCSKGASLPQAVIAAQPESLISVIGTCTGAVTIIKDGLKLDGGGSAVITASNADVVTIVGAKRVELNHITVTGGINGVVVENNGHLGMQGTTISNNLATGLLLEANSSASIDGVLVSGNQVFGIDVEASSSLIATHANTVTGTGVFGIQVNNGSSISLTNADVELHQNTLGIQLGTNAAGFLDNTSVLDASNNFADGVTIVSGAHVVNFGGQITSSGNGIHGISINSKAGLDMDAGSQVTVNGNAQDGLHLERASSMTIFNNPNFSGFNGTSTVHAVGNQGTGVNLQTNSGILVSNYAALDVRQNAQGGASMDDGSSLTFTQTIQVNGVQTTITGNSTDLLLTFGSRLTLLSNDVYGTAHCDATVLTRGPNAPACPMTSH